MTADAENRDSILRGIHVIDGGLATELEYQGARIDGPLWSAHVLEDEPEKLLAVHRAYIQAGAEVHRHMQLPGFADGLPGGGLTAEQADAALLRSVELARSAIAEFPDRRVLVAGSLGPYGAALHNGGEYPATTIAPTTIWSAFTVSASRSSREPLASRLPICSPLRLFRRSKKRARWARLWRRGLTFARGSAFPAATKSMFRTANEWPIAPRWLLRFRRRWLSASTAFRRSGFLR